MFTVLADVNVSGFFMTVGAIAVAVIAVIVIAAVFLSKRVKRRRDEEDFPTGDNR